MSRHAHGSAASPFSPPTPSTTSATVVLDPRSRAPGSTPGGESQQQQQQRVEALAPGGRDARCGRGPWALAPPILGRPAGRRGSRARTQQPPPLPHLADGLGSRRLPLLPTGREMATPLTAIPAHLLSEILLRLPAPGDLARASAACVSFRRLVTDGAFLRRFRRLHGPPLLGFLDHHDFNPAIPPHPSASGARALALAADFSFSFLPSHCCWTVQDTRDGRVLLGGIPRVQKRPVFMELVVCDPLHRRRMEFSIAELPPGEWSTRGLAIVEAGEDRLGMFGFHDATPSDLSYTIARNKGGNPNQWQMEKRISLDSGYKYDIKNATERYLVLRKTEISSSENPLAEYFSMDIKTLKFQRFCAQGTNYYGRHIYTNFPPSLLSSPTI